MQTGTEGCDRSEMSETHKCITMVANYMQEINSLIVYATQGLEKVVACSCIVVCHLVDSQVQPFQVVVVTIQRKLCGFWADPKGTEECTKSAAVPYGK